MSYKLTDKDIYKAFSFAAGELFDDVIQQITDAVREGRFPDGDPVVYELFMRLATLLVDMGWSKEEILKELSDSIDQDIIALHQGECQGNA